MSVRTTLDSLAILLNNTLPVETRIYPRPAEAVSLYDFPSIVLSIMPGVKGTWKLPAMGLGEDNAPLAIYVFVGSRQSPLSELMDRCLDWPLMIANSLVSDLQLGSQIRQLGDDKKLFDYVMGPIAWADGDYFGLIFTLPAIEPHEQYVE